MNEEQAQEILTLLAEIRDLEQSNNELLTNAVKAEYPLDESGSPDLEAGAYNKLIHEQLTTQLSGDIETIKADVSTLATNYQPISGTIEVTDQYAEDNYQISQQMYINSIIICAGIFFMIGIQLARLFWRKM